MASSDAKNISTSARLEGDDYVINGEKYYISGAGDPRCKIMITMVKTDPDAPASRQQSQILVPTDAPGVEMIQGMQVFGEDHAPRGHMHIKFNNVRVPKENILLGEGRGFEISQVRLGPGRIHHCMRSVGQAEQALELMVKRAASREAFGKKIIQLGKNLEVISRARIEIDAMRLMVLQAAKAMDVLGNKEARVYVSAVKAMVPENAVRSSTKRSKCMAQQVSRNGHRYRACTQISATCDLRTGRMRFITWWLVASKRANTAVGRRLPGDSHTQIWNTRCGADHPCRTYCTSCREP